MNAPNTAYDTSSDTRTGQEQSSSTTSQYARQRPSTTVSQRQQPTLERTTGPSVADPEAALAQQVANPEFVEFRADMAAQYVDNLHLPPSTERIPGWLLVPRQVARHSGLSESSFAGTDDPWEDLDPAEPQPPSAAVVGNTIPSFVDGVTGQQKDDVLGSCLLAQLAANARYDRMSDPFNWSKYYSTVLENIAWVVPDSQFRRFSSTQARFTMDDVVIKMLAGILTQDMKNVLTESIEAVKALKDDSGALVIFEKQSKAVTNGNFMIEPVGISGSGVLSMRLGSFLFRSRETVTKVLWFSFRGGPNTDVAINRNSLVLNEQVYDRIRPVVLERIVTRVTDYIRNVPLIEEPTPPAGFTSFGPADGWASLR